jgi:hypothetical protein
LLAGDAAGGQPQPPQRRALDQHPAAVARWLATEFPAIRARPSGRAGWCCGWASWGPLGGGRRPLLGAGRPDPVSKGTGKRFRVNLIGAISNAGMLRFRLVVGSFSGPVVIDFLGRLVRDGGGWELQLIVDGHPVHRARLVGAFIGRHADRIELHFQPGYRPELPPGGAVEP